MPKLFWKLFFALWLSIMGFAVIMVLVNNFLAHPEIPEEPAARQSRDIEFLQSCKVAGNEKNTHTHNFRNLGFGGAGCFNSNAIQATACCGSAAY